MDKTNKQVGSNLSQIIETADDFLMTLVDVIGNIDNIDSSAQQNKAHVHELEDSFRNMTQRVHKMASKSEVMQSNAQDLTVGFRGKVDTMSQNALQIKKFLNSLKKISENTHLLALNAKIEAARVGEQGKSFGVVAEEVKSLAAETQDLSKQIEHLINSIDDNTRELAQTVNNVVHMGNTIVENNVYLQGEIAEINHMSTELEEHFEKMAENSDKISTDTSELNQQSAALAEQFSDIRNTAQETKSLIEST